jgi:hypothetical protein
VVLAGVTPQVVVERRLAAIEGLAAVALADRNNLEGADVRHARRDV